METSEAQIIEPRNISFDGFPVRRSLPRIGFKTVGPWVFFDHMGPHRFAPAQGMDVLPHPHINLATVTYLFEGAIMHRDSIGSRQLITPGAVNLMVAGSGIAHSERSPEDLRNQGHRVHGLQLWHALPQADEESNPAFYHYGSGDIPVFSGAGYRGRLLIGEYGGLVSPVITFARTLYLELELEPEMNFTLPESEKELAVYCIHGEISLNELRTGPERMLDLKSNRGTLHNPSSTNPCRLAIIGGEPLGTRYMWWNFVSSRKERIGQAMEMWKNRELPEVIDDEVEFTPLPDTDGYTNMK